MNAHARILVRRRATLEAYIEQLIALLDEMDGDEDMEPDLAGTHPRDADREADDSDLEPSLGWTQAGALGGLYYLEPNGDEEDTSFSEDDMSGYIDPLQKHKARSSYSRPIVGLLK